MKYLKKVLFEEINTINERIVEIRRDLHKHPELSGKEGTKYIEIKLSKPIKMQI